MFVDFNFIAMIMMKWNWHLVTLTHKERTQFVPYVIIWRTIN